MQQEKANRSLRRYRLELVDNWHKNWKPVLAFVESVGKRPALHIDEDGWLSARQVMFVAFQGNSVAGFIVYRVQPVQDEQSRFIMKQGRAVLEAKVDSLAVDGQFEAKDVEQLLLQAARSRALELNCRHFRE